MVAPKRLASRVKWRIAEVVGLGLREAEAVRMVGVSTRSVAVVTAGVAAAVRPQSVARDLSQIPQNGLGALAPPLRDENVVAGWSTSVSYWCRDARSQNVTWELPGTRECCRERGP